MEEKNGIDLAKLSDNQKMLLSQLAYLNIDQNKLNEIKKERRRRTSNNIGPCRVS